MAFDFSLLHDHITPIRPQKVEQLFSPSKKIHETRLKDMTYRIPAPVGSPLSNYGFGTTRIQTPDPILDGRLPRHSTGLKSLKPPTPLGDQPEDQQESVASASLLDATRLTYDAVDGPVPRYRPLYRLQDSQPIRATCFHPSGEVFVVGSNTKTLRVCLYATDEELENLQPESEAREPVVLFKFLQIHRSSVYCVKFNGAGNLLATGSNDQTVHVIRYNPAKHLPEGSEYKLTMHTGTVRDLIFMPNQSSGSDLNTNSNPNSNSNSNSKSNSNSSSDQSEVLITAGAGNNHVYVTDCATMKPLQLFQGHESTIMSLHHWQDSRGQFVSASLDGTIRMWDLRAKRCATVISTNRPGGDTLASGQGGSPVGVARVEASGKLLVSGHRDGRCMFYDLRGGRVVQLFKAHEGEIRTVNFSPKSYYLLTGGYDRKIKLMDLQGDLTRKLPSVDVAQLEDRVVQTGWHPSDYTFVSTSAEGSAILWSMPAT